MDFARQLNEVREHSAALISVVSEHDPQIEVSTCPGWTLQDLLGHAVGALRWATAMSSTAPGEKAAKPSAAPKDYQEMLAWAHDSQEQGLNTLTGFGPDRPCRVFNGARPSTVAFWARRMAHEWAIHRLDGELATGKETPFRTDFSVDGVDEMLGTMLRIMSRSRRASAALQGKVLVRTTDREHGWLVEISEGSAPSVSTAVDAGADVTISGEAEQLYRAVWGRPHDALVEGNTELLAAIASP